MSRPFCVRSKGLVDALDRNLLAPVLVGAIRLYQLFFSWIFRGSCRFVPSCSSYAQEAVLKYGALRGTIRAMGRLARCHPFHPGGFDPV